MILQALPKQSKIFRLNQLNRTPVFIPKCQLQREQINEKCKMLQTPIQNGQEQNNSIAYKMVIKWRCICIGNKVSLSASLFIYEINCDEVVGYEVYSMKHLGDELSW